MVFKIVPLSEGELWGCLACEMSAGRDVDAAFLVVEGVPGWRGSVKTGLCAEPRASDGTGRVQRDVSALGTTKIRPIGT